MNFRQIDLNQFETGISKDQISGNVLSYSNFNDCVFECRGKEGTLPALRAK